VIRRAWQVMRLVLLPTIGLAVALWLVPSRASLATHVWLLVVLGLGLVAFLVIVQTAFPRTPSSFAASLRRTPTAAERPQALVRLEREASMAGSASFDVHYRLRPTITALAAELLSASRGIDLEREPNRAHAALGDDVWELVRPDRPQPAERHGAGIDEATLDRVVTALERV
jgi:hypothetical protein